MRELKPCKKCGKNPRFTPYLQSVDGNHDTPASVKCECGNKHVLTFDEFVTAKNSVPSEKRGRGYMSCEEIDAINDHVIGAWNIEQEDTKA